MKKSLLKRIMALVLAMGLLFSDMSMVSAAAPSSGSSYTTITDQGNKLYYSEDLYTIEGPAAWQFDPNGSGPSDMYLDFYSNQDNSYVGSVKLFQYYHKAGWVPDGSSSNMSLQFTSADLVNQGTSVIPADKYKVALRTWEGKAYQLNAGTSVRFEAEIPLSDMTTDTEGKVIGSELTVSTNGDPNTPNGYYFFSGTQFTNHMMKVWVTDSTSSQNMTYQWYRDGEAINGATNDSYTINSLQLLSEEDNTSYYCAVSNGTTKVYSVNYRFHYPIGMAAGTVKGNDVTVWPNGMYEHTYTKGYTESELIIAVYATSESNGNLTYQWYCDGQPISGAIGNSYTIENASQDVTYYCEVTNAAIPETVRSVDFTLTFVDDPSTPPASGNNDYANTIAGKFSATYAGGKYTVTPTGDVAFSSDPGVTYWLAVYDNNTGTYLGELEITAAKPAGNAASWSFSENELNSMGTNLAGGNYKLALSVWYNGSPTQYAMGENIPVKAFAGSTPPSTGGTLIMGLDRPQVYDTEDRVVSMDISSLTDPQTIEWKITKMDGTDLGTTCYTVDPSIKGKITLHASTVKTLLNGDNQFKLSVTVRNSSGASIHEESYDLTLCKEHYEYSYPLSGPGDAQILLGSNTTIGNRMSVWYQDANFPGGTGASCEITGVALKDQTSFDTSYTGDVLTLNPNQDNNMWILRAVSPGRATLVITYKNPKGLSETYEFPVFATNVKYNLSLSYNNAMLVGATKIVEAMVEKQWVDYDGTHYSHHNERVNDFTLSVSQSSNQMADFVINGKTVTVTSKALGSSNVIVEASQRDNNGDIIFNCVRDLHVDIMKEYYMIEMDDAKAAINKGEILDLTKVVKLTHYYTDASDMNHSIDATNNADVEWQLAYVDGNVWEVQNAGTGTGLADLPKLKRLNWNTGTVEIKAVIPNTNGDPFQSGNRTGLNAPNYNISLGNENETHKISEAETKEIQVNIDNLIDYTGSEPALKAGVSLDVKVGWFDNDTFYSFGNNNDKVWNVAYDLNNQVAVITMKGAEIQKGLEAGFDSNYVGAAGFAVMIDVVVSGISEPARHVQQWWEFEATDNNGGNYGPGENYFQNTNISHGEWTLTANSDGSYTLTNVNNMALIGNEQPLLKFYSSDGNRVCDLNLEIEPGKTTYTFTKDAITSYNDLIPGGNYHVSLVERCSNGDIIYGLTPIDPDDPTAGMIHFDMIEPVIKSGWYQIDVDTSNTPYAYTVEALSSSIAELPLYGNCHVILELFKYYESVENGNTVYGYGEHRGTLHVNPISKDSTIGVYTFTADDFEAEGNDVVGALYMVRMRVEYDVPGSNGERGTMIYNLSNNPIEFPYVPISGDDSSHTYNDTEKGVYNIDYNNGVYTITAQGSKDFSFDPQNVGVSLSVYNSDGDWIIDTDIQSYVIANDKQSMTIQAQDVSVGNDFNGTIPEGTYNVALSLFIQNGTPDPVIERYGLGSVYVAEMSGGNGGDQGGEGEEPGVSGDDITITTSYKTHALFDHGSTEEFKIGVDATSRSQDNNFTYQWYCNGQAIAGADSNQLKIENLTADAVYYCEVSNGVESLDSMEFTFIFTVNVQFDAQGGTFEYVVGNNPPENVYDTGFGVPIGKTSLQEGVSVSNPVWRDATRTFVGWMMYVLPVGEEERELLYDEPINTSAALGYQITAAYRTIYFEAQWSSNVSVEWADSNVKDFFDTQEVVLPLTANGLDGIDYAVKVNVGVAGEHGPILLENATNPLYEIMTDEDGLLTGIKLHGDEIRMAATQEGLISNADERVQLDVSVMIETEEGELVAELNTMLEMCLTGLYYDYRSDFEDLIFSNDYIRNKMNVRIVDENNPNGLWEEVSVTDVSIEILDGATDAFVLQQVADGWNIKFNSIGKVEVTVEYELYDQNGATDTYIYMIEAVSEQWGIQWTANKLKELLLPGESMVLSAEAIRWIPTEDGEGRVPSADISGGMIIWDYDIIPGATYNAVGKDLTIQVSANAAQDNFEVYAGVIAVDTDGNPIVDADGNYTVLAVMSKQLMITNEYYTVSPEFLDDPFEWFDTQVVTPKVYRWFVGANGQKSSEEITSNAWVKLWYMSTVFEMSDANGNPGILEFPGTEDPSASMMLPVGEAFHIKRIDLQGNEILIEVLRKNSNGELRGVSVDKSMWEVDSEIPEIEASIKADVDGDTVAEKVTEISLKVDETLQLTADVIPSELFDYAEVYFATAEDIDDVEDNEGTIISITNGLLNAVAPGESKVHLMVDGEAVAECTVVVIEELFEKWSINWTAGGDQKSLLPGEETTLTAEVICQMVNADGEVKAEGDATAGKLVWDTPSNSAIIFTESGNNLTIKAEYSKNVQGFTVAATVYAIDENGDYVTDENGDKIILVGKTKKYESTSVSYVIKPETLSEPFGWYATKTVTPELYQIITDGDGNKQEVVITDDVFFQITYMNHRFEIKDANGNVGVPQNPDNANDPSMELMIAAGDSINIKRLYMGVHEILVDVFVEMEDGTMRQLANTEWVVASLGSQFLADKDGDSEAEPVEVITLEVGESMALSTSVNASYQFKTEDALNGNAADEAIIVFEDGMITAKKPGVSKIYLIVDGWGKNAECVVVVNKPINTDTTGTTTAPDNSKPVDKVSVVEDPKTEEDVKQEVTSLIEKVVMKEDDLEQVIDQETQKKLTTALENGEEVGARIVMNPMTDSDVAKLPVEEKKALKEQTEELVGKNVNVVYMDVSVKLYNETNGVFMGDIRELEEPIEITIAIPENLKDKIDNGKCVILRYHKGKVEKLPTTVNADGTITFITDKFSTYTLVYEESNNGAAGEQPIPQPTPQPQAPSQNAPQNTQNAPTGDTAPVVLYMAMAMVAVVLMIVAETKRRAVRR